MDSTSRLLGKRRIDAVGEEYEIDGRDMVGEVYSAVAWKRKRVLEEGVRTKDGETTWREPYHNPENFGAESCLDYAPQEANAWNAGGSHGQRFEDIHARDRARVHNGNEINNGNQVFHVTGDCYLGTQSLPVNYQKPYGTATSLRRVQARDMRLDYENGVTGSLKTVIDMLQSAMLDRNSGITAETILSDIFESILRSGIPKKIDDNVAYLVDAFDRRCRIDIDIVPDWAAFDYLLQHRFKKRGSRKIQRREYLLQDASTPSFISQRKRPEFGQVFRNRSTIKMSMFFKQAEVGHNCCPRCKNDEEYSPGIEVVCRTCKFAYTPGVVEEVTEETSSTGTPTAAQSDARSTIVPRPVPIDTDSDRPEHFNRVSIGAKASEGTSHSSMLPNQQSKELGSARHDGLDSLHPQKPQETKDSWKCTQPQQPAPRISAVSAMHQAEAKLQSQLRAPRLSAVQQMRQAEAKRLSSQSTSPIGGSRDTEQVAQMTSTLQAFLGQGNRQNRRMQGYTPPIAKTGDVFKGESYQVNGSQLNRPALGWLGSLENVQ